EVRQHEADPSRTADPGRNWHGPGRLHRAGDRGLLVTLPDRITRELILPVARQRVWAALTEPARLSAWFGQQAEVDLRPGGAVTFVWDGSTGARGTNHGVVEIVDPPHRFAFRWRTIRGYDDRPLAPGTSTLVEFILHEHPSGTRLELIESGFASLPPE